MTSLLRKSHLISTGTGGWDTIGSVGSAGQTYAGHAPVHESATGSQEPGTSWSEVLAMYYFNDDGNGITTDRKGTYTLTNNGSISTGDGIFGSSSKAASFNGSTQYFTQGTLLDTTPTAIAIDCWFQSDDGQPASDNMLAAKLNNQASDFINLEIKTTGKIQFTTQASGSTKFVSSITTLPNGTVPWHYLVCTWDTSYGIRLFLDGVLEATDSSATTLMGNNSGTFQDFIIGAYNYGGTPSNYFDGKISYFRIQNRVLSQKDVDVAYATTYTWTQDSSFALEDADITPYVQEDGNSDFITQYSGDLEVARYNNTIYRYGGIFGASDKLKLVGRE